MPMEGGRGCAKERSTSCQKKKKKKKKKKRERERGNLTSSFNLTITTTIVINAIWLAKLVTGNHLQHVFQARNGAAPTQRG